MALVVEAECLDCVHLVDDATFVRQSGYPVVDRDVSRQDGVAHAVDVARLALYRRRR